MSVAVTAVVVLALSALTGLITGGIVAALAHLASRYHRKARR